MDAWAAKYGASAAFVCVSCAGPQLAAEFGRRLKLQHCHNTWVDEDDMPTWGQLGCNGFIVLDGSHSVACRASAAYLQVSERAFRHVEELIDSLLGSNRAPPLLEGGDGSSGSSACAKVRFGTDTDEDHAEADTAPLPKAASVNVAVLDAEHAHCEAALAALAARRDAAALGHLLHAYEAHFAHEEALLDEHLYADVRGDGSEPAGAAFSADRGARASHYADHERMVRRVRSALVAAADSPIGPAVVSGLVAEFARHTSAYDSAYADRLHSAMEMAPAAAVAQA